MLRLVQIPASFQFGFLGPLQTGIMREELYAIFFALLFYFSLTLIISHIIGVPLVLEVRRLRRESLSVSVCISLCVCVKRARQETLNRCCRLPPVWPTDAGSGEPCIPQYLARIPRSWWALHWMWRINSFNDITAFNLSVQKHNGLQRWLASQIQLQATSAPFIKSADFTMEIPCSC